MLGNKLARGRLRSPLSFLLVLTLLLLTLFFTPTRAGSIEKSAGHSVHRRNHRENAIRKLQRRGPGGAAPAAVVLKELGDAIEKASEKGKKLAGEISGPSDQAPAFSQNFDAKFENLHGKFRVPIGLSGHFLKYHEEAEKELNEGKIGPELKEKLARGLELTLSDANKAKLAEFEAERKQKREARDALLKRFEPRLLAHRSSVMGSGKITLFESSEEASKTALQLLGLDNLEGFRQLKPEQFQNLPPHLNEVLKLLSSMASWLEAIEVRNHQTAMKLLQKAAGEKYELERKRFDREQMFGIVANNHGSQPSTPKSFWDNLTPKGVISALTPRQSFQRLESFQDRKSRPKQEDLDWTTMAPAPPPRALPEYWKKIDKVKNLWDLHPHYFTVGQRAGPTPAGSSPLAMGEPAGWRANHGGFLGGNGELSQPGRSTGNGKKSDLVRSNSLPRSFRFEPHAEDGVWVDRVPHSPGVAYPASTPPSSPDHGSGSAIGEPTASPRSSNADSESSVSSSFEGPRPGPAQLVVDGASIAPHRVGAGAVYSTQQSSSQSTSSVPGSMLSPLPPSSAAGTPPASEQARSLGAGASGPQDAHSGSDATKLADRLSATTPDRSSPGMLDAVQTPFSGEWSAAPSPSSSTGSSSSLFQTPSETTDVTPEPGSPPPQVPSLPLDVPSLPVALRPLSLSPPPPPPLPAAPLARRLDTSSRDLPIAPQSPRTPGSSSTLADGGTGAVPSVTGPQTSTSPNPFETSESFSQDTLRRTGVGDMLWSQQPGSGADSGGGGASPVIDTRPIDFQKTRSFWADQGAIALGGPSVKAPDT